MGKINVRLAKAVTIQPLSQTKTMLVTDAAFLDVIKPRGEVAERYTVSAANGVVEV